MESTATATTTEPSNLTVAVAVLKVVCFVALIVGFLIDAQLVIGLALLGTFVLNAPHLARTVRRLRSLGD